MMELDPTAPLIGPAIGQPLARREDTRFLSGTACYVDDLKRPGMVHMVVVRSAVAHARIRAIDSAAARALDGVLAVFTFGDIAALAKPIPIRLAPLDGFERFLQMPLAQDRVRYVGEPVAVVIARDRYVAEDAADLVAIDYDELDPMVDAASSITDRVLLFEAAGTNRAAHYTVSRGDPGPRFAGADDTRKETFRCHRHSAMPLETRGLIAQWDAAAAKLTVSGATKVLFFNRRALAPMLRLEERQIDMVELDVGGSFGVRGEFYPEDFLVPFAAMRLGRPVKWIEDRREAFIATNHSREIDCELEIAARRDGTILALRGRILADLGAYVRTNGGVVPAKAAEFLPGPYRIADFECEVTVALTNKTPVGTYRGPGRYEANFFRERLLDMMAADLGLDPADVRLKNLLRPDELPFPLGKLVPYSPASAYDGGDYPAALRRALAAIDYPRLAAARGPAPDGRLHGVGIGCFVESSGAGPAESARIVVEAPGRVALYTGVSTAGQGHETVLAQILADALGVPIGGITVFHGSTSYVERGYGTYASRAIVMGGSAVTVAAANLVLQVLAFAAERLNLEPDELIYRDGLVFRRGGNEPVLTLDGLADEAVAGSTAAAAALHAAGTFENSKLTYSYGTHVAHVAVDPETAQVEVIRFIAVEDIGRAVNPLLVHGQAIGSAVQGLGGAFLDQLVYDAAGQLLTGSFADYLLPTSTDFPNIEAITLEDAPSTLNPLGVKGAGEGGIVASGAAVANAVADALRPLGVTICDLPLSLDNLARWLREVRSQQ